MNILILASKNDFAAKLHNLMEENGYHAQIAPISRPELSERTAPDLMAKLQLLEYS